ncbi:mitochondrial distribution and morphology protein 38 [Monosporozyma unispora]|nr:ribosome-binding protein mdm38 [Kazachstania unispora]
MVYSIVGNNSIRGVMLRSIHSPLKVKVLTRFYSVESSSKKSPVTTTPATIKDTPKKTVWIKVKEGVKHYVDGTKLLGYEIKISTFHLGKLISGYELTRRESNQLKRTMSDLFRLIPFSAFVIIPFAELFLPLALKFFPNLLPSTYESSQQRQRKQLKLVEMKQLTAKYIKDTWKLNKVDKNKSILPDTVTAQNKALFDAFFNKLYMGKRIPSMDISFTTKEVKNVAEWFKNDTILDNLSRGQLIAMAKFISITPWGNDNILRMQIRMKLKQLIVDDKRLDYESVASLTPEELHVACISRGIKTFGPEVTQESLRRDLDAWLQLRLKDKIPSVLLILSSTFTFNVNLKTPWPYDNMTVQLSDGVPNPRVQFYYNAVLQVLASIPDPVYNMAKLDIHEIITPKGDKSTRAQEDEFKLNALKEQEELIKREQKETQARKDANLQKRHNDTETSLDEDTTAH